MTSVARDKWFNDGSRATAFADGTWDLQLPDLTHQRGRADTPDGAMAAAEWAHVKYVVAQWERGFQGRSGEWVCPLRTLPARGK